MQNIHKKKNAVDVSTLPIYNYSYSYLFVTWKADIMYLTRLKLNNTGPIDHADIVLKFNSDGSPKPIIFVGQNGAGKSIATAYIVNALIAAHGTIFEDSDVEKGKVYKLRSPTYIRNGATYSTAELDFSNGFRVREGQFSKQKNQYEAPFPNYSKWNEVPEDETSHYSTNFHERINELRKDLNNNTHIFFPPNRFEEPAWLNELNLRNKANYASLKNYTNYSNRPVIIYAPMRDLQNWLLDLIYDSNVLEKNTVIVPANQIIGNQAVPFKQLTIQNGPAASILTSISVFLKKLFEKDGNLKWSVGRRNIRSVGIFIDNEKITQNLFQLSTGQAILLDLFLSIVRDFDLGNSNINELSDISGIVIVDEIDLHLHTDFQHDLLPNLIRLFPKVQFILTTHSPLFLIGMEKTFTSEGFQLVELPYGREIEVERFSEFEAAYRHMCDSARFQADVQARIEDSKKPVIYLEGTTDIDYIKKSANILGKEYIIDQFDLVDAVGCSHLNKIWDTYKTHLGETIKQKWILLYDCDVNKSSSQSGNLFRRTIPQQEHKISSGIENLFPDNTIQRAIEYKTAFVDISGEHTITDRGVKKIVPEEWKINKDEKRNLCDWICENSEKNDFDKFLIVFDILENILSL